MLFLPSGSTIHDGKPSLSSHDYAESKTTTCALTSPNAAPHGTFGIITYSA